MIAGEWTDPARSKITLGDYAVAWIAERPGLRPRTVDLYSWLLEKHITPYLGGVPIGNVSTGMIREWRADLLRNGVSVSMAAKAYRAGARNPYDRGRRRQNPGTESVPRPGCR